jgi:hypothetical protein
LGDFFTYSSGLPDGLFSYQNANYGRPWDEKVWLFHDNLVFGIFIDICHFYGHFDIFMPFWLVVSRQNLATLVTLVRTGSLPERWRSHYFFDSREQGCQMAYFQTKNPNLGKFWRVLQWKMLIYFVAIWSILWLFGKFPPILVCCAEKNLATLAEKKSRRFLELKKIIITNSNKYVPTYHCLLFLGIYKLSITQFLATHPPQKTGDHRFESCQVFWTLCIVVLLFTS